MEESRDREYDDDEFELMDFHELLPIHHSPLLAPAMHIIGTDMRNLQFR